VDVLLASAVSWNRGDLDGFMAPYENSERVSYGGSTGFVHGFDRLRESYARGFWAQGAPADSLAFEVIEVRPMDDEVALMLGHFILTSRSTGQRSSHGYFTLVWIHTEDGWKMAHDHTSQAP
jgi:ketosteroid isomerase-like protein